MGTPIEADEIREVVKFYLPRMLVIPISFGLTKEQDRALQVEMESEINAGLDQAMQIIARRIKERTSDE